MKPLNEILKDDGITARMNIPTSSSADSPGANSHSPQERANASPARQANAPLLDSVCPRCGGVGFVVMDLPMGHPDFGKAVPCTCRQQERLEKRVRALQERSSLAALQRLTFESFIPEPSHLPPSIAYNVHRAFDTCVYYAQEPRSEEHTSELQSLRHL